METIAKRIYVSVTMEGLKIWYISNPICLRKRFRQIVSAVGNEIFSRVILDGI